jgi:hypothetical protein
MVFELFLDIASGNETRRAGKFTIASMIFPSKPPYSFGHFPAVLD